MAETVIEGVEKLMEVAKADYQGWWKNQEMTEVRQRMIAQFNDGMAYSVGHKYIRVMSGESVHSFVVNTDQDKKFKLGDILMPAGWKTPARNFARGNVLSEDFSRVRWTGAH